MKLVEKCSQMPIKDMILDIDGVVGSRPELRFIKLMLVSSQSL